MASVSTTDPAAVDLAAVDLGRVVVAFARSLRAAGLVVPVDATIAYGEALALVGIERGARVYWAGRATFVRRTDDIVVYDRVFAAFFGGLAGGPAPAESGAETVLALDADLPDGPEPESDDAAEPSDDEVVTVRFSRVEVLRERDFAEYSAEEHDEARHLIAAIAVAGPFRASRRLEPTRRSRRHPDLRRSVRDSLRTDGELIRRASRRRSQRPRRIVLLLDVSGSMEPYARALVRFLHAAVVARGGRGGRGGVETFTLGTRLTRITRELATRDPDAALSAAADRVADWSGGTRLGETLRAFNDEWGVRGMARGAVVVVLSDGWDRGAPDLLGDEMARLARVATRVVWVNPLKASPGYVPLAQGMAAALPHVDEFVEGHSLAALERVAAAIAREGT